MTPSIKDKKNIRKICLVSSTLFNLSACVYNWMAPLGAALGCMSDLVDDGRLSDNEEQLNMVIDFALRDTLSSTTSSSQRKILTELCDSKVETSNLREIIKQTEAYQMQYCTDIDAKEIVNRFEVYFRDHLSRTPSLYRLYILSTGIATLEELKGLYDVLYDERQELDSIHKEVIKTNDTLTKIEKTISLWSCEASFVLASMTPFLLAGTLNQNGFPQFWIIAGFISYCISGVLSYYLEKNDYFRLCSKARRVPVTLLKYRATASHFLIMMHSLLTLLLRSLISVSCFLMVVLSTSTRNQEVLKPAIFAILVGGVVGSLLKSFRQEINATTTDGDPRI